MNTTATEIQAPTEAELDAQWMAQAMADYKAHGQDISEPRQTIPVSFGWAYPGAGF